MPDQRSFYDYEGFVDKFKNKKTTDDCYTPQPIYDAILEWCRREYDIPAAAPILRPFKPGGDYQCTEYPEGCYVVDNPPFSILSEIRRWYLARGIKYFLFAPALTIFSSKIDDCAICTAAAIVYANGAEVHTSFVTNLAGDYVAMSAPSLRHTIDDAVEALAATEKKELPRYEYPDNVVTASMLNELSKRDEVVRIDRRASARIARLDAQVPIKKTIFGSGFLVGNAKASDIAKAKAKVAPLVFELSQREREQSLTFLIVKAVSDGISRAYRRLSRPCAWPRR